MNLILSLCKKVWFTIGAYCSPSTNNILDVLSMQYGFDFTQFSYPDILTYLESTVINNKIGLHFEDYERLAKLLPADQYTLDERAVLIYSTEDNLIPLVLTFNNVRTGSAIYISLLYENDGNILGFSAYSPDRNFLAMSYLNSKNTFIIRIGTSKVLANQEELDWNYNVYIYRDKIVNLTSPPQKRGSVWFTRPFKAR